VFNKLSSGMDQYLDYAQGFNLTNRMPLWIQPTQPVSVQKVIALMRDHFEGTWFDFSSDVGAGPFGAPYRWRPLTWESHQNQYTNERAIATQQTGSTFVAQMRSYLPDPVGGISWYGVDDSGLAVHVPVFCGITDIPNSLRYDLADLMTFSFDSAFWVFNLVNNFVYTRYNAIYPEVATEIAKREADFFSEVAVIEQKAVDLINNNQKDAAIQLLTAYSTTSYQQLVKDWLKYFTYLFLKFMDGNIKTPNPQNPKMPNVNQPGYGDSWYSRVASETGARYEIPPNQFTAGKPVPAQRWSAQKLNKI